MKISTEIASAAALVGEEKAVEYTAKAGFDAWDFSMFDMCKYDWSAGCFLPNDNPLASDNYLAFARRLKQIGLDNGILCNQSHAPFPSRGPIIPYLKRALECTAEAGGKICIIHPDNYLSAQENAEMYFDLLPFAKECGVKIATENMWGWDTEKDQSSFAACATSASFNEHLDIVNDDFFVACLDIGHAEMRGSGEGAANMIRALGNRLQALHIHDNDCWHDSHQIPFSMSIDFDAVVKALKDINLEIPANKITAFIGPSGCGKSTLLHLIAGLLTPEKGLIKINGSYHPDNTSGVGYMLQKDHLLEWRTIYKNVLLGLEIRRELTAEKLAYVNQLLSDYGLDKFRSAHPSELSGGMRQRAAPIRTLALKPELLLLDEPFSALDSQTRLSVSDDIGRILHQEKKTAILVTHDISEAISMADRVIILSPRPAIIRKIVPICFDLENRTPMASRNAPEFKSYFNLIWKELNHDV